MALIGAGEFLTLIFILIAVYVFTLYLAYRYGKNSGKTEVMERLEEKKSDSD